MKILAIALFCLSLIGCATSGNTSNSLSFTEEPRTLFVSKHYSGYEERHLGEIMRLFEKHGFAITREKENSIYSLDYSIDAGATLTVEIALLKNNKSILDVSATNVWMGTVMFRPVAVKNRISAALSELDELLTEKM